MLTAINAKHRIKEKIDCAEYLVSLPLVTLALHVTNASDKSVLSMQHDLQDVHHSLTLTLAHTHTHTHTHARMFPEACAVFSHEGHTWSSWIVWAGALRR